MPVHVRDDIQALTLPNTRHLASSFLKLQSCLNPDKAIQKRCLTGDPSKVG